MARKIDKGGIALIIKLLRTLVFSILYSYFANMSFLVQQPAQSFISQESHQQLIDCQNSSFPESTYSALSPWRAWQRCDGRSSFHSSLSCAIYMAFSASTFGISANNDITFGVTQFRSIIRTNQYVANPAPSPVSRIH